MTDHLYIIRLRALHPDLVVISVDQDSTAQLAWPQPLFTNREDLPSRVAFSLTIKDSMRDRHPARLETVVMVHQAPSEVIFVRSGANSNSPEDPIMAPASSKVQTQ